jgi:hypothetical protein
MKKEKGKVGVQTYITIKVCIEEKYISSHTRGHKGDERKITFDIFNVNQKEGRHDKPHMKGIVEKSFFVNGQGDQRSYEGKEEPYEGGIIPFKIEICEKNANPGQKNK